MLSVKCFSLPSGGLFFFSSRRRHTRWTGDWSSDVCSSDLVPPAGRQLRVGPVALPPVGHPVGAVEIGRASCRERVEISVVAGSLKKKNRQRTWRRKAWRRSPRTKPPPTRATNDESRAHLTT